jgi:hypothetical protein
MTYVTTQIRRQLTNLAGALAAMGAFAASAGAAELPPFLRLPSAATSVAPNLAVLYELKLQLPEGRGLAQLLEQAGVDRDGAATAARLAAGHLGEGIGGCDIKVTVTRPAGSAELKLQRIMVATLAGQTVIERRSGELTVASVDNAAGKISRLI